MRFMSAIRPMKMSARFHAKSKLFTAPKKMTTRHTRRNTISAALLSFLMKRKLLSA